MFSSATGNTVTLNGNNLITFGANTILYGGYVISGGGDAFTGNTLNKNNATSVPYVRNFEFVNFGYTGDANIGDLDTSPVGSTQEGVVLDTDDNDILFNGAIKGTGTLTKQGTGTLALLGENTLFTKDLVIEGGLIQFEKVENFGTNNKIILNGGGLQWATGNTLDISSSGRLDPIGGDGGIFDTNGNDVKFETPLTGTGGITKTGEGKLTLEGHNTYSGPTAILEGTLVVTGTLGVLDVVNSVYDYGGAIENNGTLTFDLGQGVQMLTGNISGAGPTKITGGELIVAGTLGDVNDSGVYVHGGAIENNGTLTFDLDQDVQMLTGNISGAGPTKITGGELVVAGTLGDVNDSGVYVHDGDIENNGTLTFDLDRSVSQTLEGTIGGTGKFTKEGGGTLTLAGANNVNSGNAPFHVKDGTLRLDGALKSDVEVGEAAAEAPMASLLSSWPGRLVRLNTTGEIFDSPTFDHRGTVKGHVTIHPDATLNVHSNAIIENGKLTVGNGNKDNPANLNFYLHDGIVNGETLLTINGTGTASIKGSKISLSVDDNWVPNLNSGDKVTLIDMPDWTTGDNPLVFSKDENTYGDLDLEVASGIFQRYSYKFEIDEETSEPNGAGGSGTSRLIAYLLSVDELVPDNPRTKALADGYLAGTAYLNQGADLLAGRGMQAALAAARPGKDGNGLNAFAVLGGSRLTHKTGSHIDADGYHLIAGLTGARQVSAGEITLGAFIEHGEGNYSTVNNFVNDARVHGHGDADYTGAGFLARLKLAETARGHTYAEASVRYGKVELDYKASDMTDGLGRRAAYDSSTHYASAHAGIGHQWRIDEKTALTLYGQYLWSRQGSDSVKLPTGNLERDRVKFQAVESHRTRLGARWEHTLGQTTGKFHLGAAWEREYDGKAKARADIPDHRLDLDAPELKGDTGTVEAGITLTPGTNNRLTLEIDVQGHTGRREGFTGGIRGNYKF